MALPTRGRNTDRGPDARAAPRGRASLFPRFRVPQECFVTAFGRVPAGGQEGAGCARRGGSRVGGGDTAVADETNAGEGARTP